MHLVKAIEYPIYFAIITADEVIGFLKGDCDKIGLIICIIAAIIWGILEWYHIQEYLNERK